MVFGSLKSGHLSTYQVFHDSSGRVLPRDVFYPDSACPPFRRFSFMQERTITSTSQPHATMTSIQPIYDPASDSSLITFQRHQDEEGNFLDIDTTIFHGEHGFYLQEKKVQIWIDRCWENVTDEDKNFAPAHARRRVVSCPLSPLTKEQVIRMVVEQFVPEEEGALALALGILDQHGIH
jgi:hypothetical protein